MTKINTFLFLSLTNDVEHRYLFYRSLRNQGLKTKGSHCDITIVDNYNYFFLIYNIVWMICKVIQVLEKHCFKLVSYSHYILILYWSLQITSLRQKLSQATKNESEQEVERDRKQRDFDRKLLLARDKLEEKEVKKKKKIISGLIMNYFNTSA